MIMLFIEFPRTDVYSAVFDLKKMCLFEMVTVSLSTGGMTAEAGSGRTGWHAIVEFKQQRAGCSSSGTAPLS